MDLNKYSLSYYWSCRLYLNSFDGDQLNKYLPVDNDLRRRYKRFEVHNGFYELKEPWKISDDMNFPNPVARLLTNFVLDGGITSVEN